MGIVIVHVKEHCMSRLRSLALVVLLLATLTACTTQPVATAGAVVIDVRTSQEFAQGHLEGALNLDLQSGSFEAAVAKLPSDGSYLVYCRSGNRSGQAARIMTDLGFTTVKDLGALENAAATTGLPVVTR